MEKFIGKHADNIHGVLNCFDRVIFKGYNPLSWSKNMEEHMSHNGILLKDFKKYATGLSEQMRKHGLETAQRHGRPYFRPEGKYDKEERAREIAERDEIMDGLVCVMSAMESSPTFKMVAEADKHVDTVSVSVLLHNGRGVRDDARPDSDISAVHGSGLCERA